ncbi:hypothetical protein [Bradyrhizobium sp. HKCCYLR20261]|uniref:hypothetical protein n=1 Tax=Bradyrhizobium sp. HKCCYLR20261 TaxID=3420760 RepID=UPI003EB8FBF6
MTRYLVEVQASNVPDNLAGVPLAVEIFDQDGKASRNVLQLSGEPLKRDVPGEGTYLVRTTLPSGRVISSIAETPAVADENGLAVGRTVLDLQEADALAEFWREAKSFLGALAAIQESVKQGAPIPPWVASWVNELLARGKENAGGILQSALAYVLDKIGLAVLANLGGEDAGPTIEPPPAAPILNFRCGSFVEWEAHGAPTGSTIVLKPLQEGTIGLDGTIPAPMENIRAAHLFEIADSTKQIRSLVVWKPGINRRPARLSLDFSTVGYRSGSMLSASFDPEEDPITASCFEYLTRGAFEDARLGLEALVPLLKQGYAEADPIRGILAGYVLYKLGEPSADTFIRSLCERSPDVADVHVLACAQSIAAGKSDEALLSFNEAFVRGIPAFTEGIKLLRDGANYFRDLHPQDESVRQLARRASAIAAAANFDSTLACLRLGLDLDVRFL